MLKINAMKMLTVCLSCAAVVGCEETANNDAILNGILGAVGSTVVSLLLGLLFGV